MKFRTLITVGIVVLLFGVLAASLLSLTKVLGDAAHVALSERLEDDNKVLLETWAYRQRVQHSEVRVAASEPRLKAVVGSDEIGQETIDGVAIEMKGALGADVFILLDGAGRVIVDANHPDAAGADMSQNDLIERTRRDGSGSAVWVEGSTVYQVQAEQLAFGRRGIGVLVTGRVVNDEFAEAVFRQTGAGVVVELDGEVVARSQSIDGQAIPSSDLDPLLAGVSGGDSDVQLAGGQYIQRTDKMPGYTGSHKVRYVIVRSLQQAMQPAERLKRLLFLILGAALLVGVGFALWLSRLLSRPLERLATFVHHLGGGHLDARADVEGPSEVRSLASAMNTMAVELQTSRAELADKERLEKEMEIAETVQTSILPRSLAVEGFDIDAAMRPADEVGGDYYDVLPANDGCWIGIGDVAGHGLPAGIIMLMLQSCVSSLVRSQPDAAPSEHVTVLNRVIYDNVRQRLTAKEHVTFSLLRVHADGLVRFAGAHEDILVWRAAEERVERVETPGTWLGGRPDIAKVTRDSEFRLQRGDRMLLYTDGIIEAQNDAGIEYGVEGLLRFLETSKGMPVKAAREKLMEEAAAWTQTQVDDISVLLLEFRA